jgi:hypothetical protein
MTEHTNDDWATLLPCPFCGADPEWRYKGNEYSKSRSITIRCPKCRFERTDAAMRHDFNWLERVSAEAWNRRAALAQPSAEPVRCTRCGRYEDGSRQCPNGDPACPIKAAAGVPAVHPPSGDPRHSMRDDEAFRQHQRDRIAEAQRHDAEQAKPSLTSGAKGLGDAQG